jgi:hypothetical protein
VEPDEFELPEVLLLPALVVPGLTLCPPLLDELVEVLDFGATDVDPPMQAEKSARKIVVVPTE